MDFRVILKLEHKFLAELAEDCRAFDKLTELFIFINFNLLNLYVHMMMSGVLREEKKFSSSSVWSVERAT